MGWCLETHTSFSLLLFLSFSPQMPHRCSLLLPMLRLQICTYMCLTKRWGRGGDKVPQTCFRKCFDGMNILRKQFSWFAYAQISKSSAKKTTTTTKRKLSSMIWNKKQTQQVSSPLDLWCTSAHTESSKEIALDHATWTNSSVVVVRIYSEWMKEKKHAQDIYT